VNCLPTKLIFLIALTCLVVLAFAGLFEGPIGESWWDGR
jgi:hypothetical protein